MPTLDELRKTRINKLDTLLKKGINPYPSRVNHQHTIFDARDSLTKDVAIAGRILRQRGHGKIMFFDIQDETAKIQVVLKEDVCNNESFQMLPLLDIGDFVSVQGEVGKTEAGEVSVFASDFQIITKAILPLPDKWHGFTDVEERYRKRYLDTILNADVKKRIVQRSQIIDAIRDFLTNKGFLEIETPTLQPVYGGGFARPFSTHHNELDANFYLRISDEMYLKRLIVGGFEKVFEITKVFRNEGIDRDHNPEFTMFEAQIAYQDYVYGMDIIEEIVEFVTKRVLGTTTFTYQDVQMSVQRPWSRYTMVEAICKFVGINPLDWKTLEEAKKVILTLKIEEKKLKTLHTMNTLGECIAFVFEEMVEELLIQPTIIYDYPIEVSPLAKKCQDPRFTQRFEFFAFGSELGNNYSELNDPIDLKKRFVDEKKREKAGFEEAHQTDNDYLEAIEHGFPPTCGLGVGIDRLVMLLTDAKSIKEVIPFPTLRPELPMTQEVSVVPKRTQEIKETKQDIGIDRKSAQVLLEEHIKDPITRMHCRESEVIMQAVAKKLGADEKTWGIIGLLHDIDWEHTKTETTKHGILAADILKKAGGSEFLIETIQSHVYGEGWSGVFYGPPEFKEKKRETMIQHALASSETLTGLIIACAMVQPDKKLASVKLDSLKKKFNTAKFAAGCNREIIKECEHIGISIDEFLNLGLTAVQQISGELGL